MGEACTSRKLKSALGTRTRTRINVNVALDIVQVGRRSATVCGVCVFVAAQCGRTIRSRTCLWRSRITLQPTRLLIWVGGRLCCVFSTKVLSLRDRYSSRRRDSNPRPRESRSQVRHRTRRLSIDQWRSQVFESVGTIRYDTKKSLTWTQKTKWSA